jgi:hypothetical protein
MSHEVIPYETVVGEVAPTTLFGTADPAQAMQQMTQVADTLAAVVHKQNLVKRIGQSDHVLVEGWTFLGSLLGVFPIVVWTKPVIRDEQQVGWEARVEARTRAGELVGAAEAECLTDEGTWKGRPDYARRSMAQTRAVSKALRMPLGFVMQLAGFNPTPAEEMTDSTREPTASGAMGIDADVSQAAAHSAEPASLVEEVFGGDAAPDDGKPATAAQLKKLNLMVGPMDQDMKRRVYATVALWRVRSTDALILELGGVYDGALHWSPLRDSLTKDEAHRLIDRLEAHAKEQA